MRWVRASGATSVSSGAKIARSEIFGNSSTTKPWRSRAWSTNGRDYRRQLLEPAADARGLDRLLDQALCRRDEISHNNIHLFQEVSLAGSEILQLQEQVRDLEQELEGAHLEHQQSEASLSQLQYELQVAQEEPVTRAYVATSQHPLSSSDPPLDPMPLPSQTSQASDPGPILLYPQVQRRRRQILHRPDRSR
ncbi:hypothetical protein PI124_g21317 [Phytophthora idaei]|nr:hypothetical protein PI126_g15356 [Phytophthora idaei]KAG3233613.1 hypothetical protein PI124_g21317 [Phytophthora idaei]